MELFNILDRCIGILYLVLALLTVHFVFFGVIGIFRKKRFPTTEQKLRYGIIIPARNEESVVAGLIESVRKNNYPQDKLDVFVIAHNCTDRTAEVARATGGAIVYEYNNPEECTMGYAFRYLFDRIRDDYGIESYDGFFLFNADNILDKQYFEKMNDAFVACNRKCVITSFRSSKNFGSNLMSAMYGLYFAYGCRFESRGRTVLGCSTRVQGTGYVINSSIVKDGWKYVTLTEDWEFTADQILQGNKIVFCDDAVFYDEQPTTVRVMWRQRVRWAKGHLLVCISRMKDLIRSILKPRKRGGGIHKGSLFDITVNILPFCVITTAVTLLQLIVSFIRALISEGFWSALVAGFIKGLPMTLFSYGLMVVASALIYILERKRIPKMPIWIKIVSAFIWPIFLLMSFPCEIVALFTKNVGWKPIPHSDTTSFDTLNEESEESDVSKQD
ncbi:MAG: glycosyltransferase family 2 protein [Clostridia bacterium]|nr:glycosyltransferase family 2 protein [Clostridia bacterium]